MCRCVHVCTCSSGSGSQQPVGTQASGAFMSRCQQLETPEDPAASYWTDEVSKSSCWRDLYYIHVSIPCSQAFILISQMGETRCGCRCCCECMRAVFWSVYPCGWLCVRTVHLHLLRTCAQPHCCGIQSSNSLASSG